MTEYVITILNDGGFYASIITFSGLFLFFALLGYFIKLIVALLYKIIR